MARGLAMARHQAVGIKARAKLAGWSAPSIFEGGRSPIIRRIPKRGFNNRHGRIVKSINVSDLESAFEAGTNVTPELLRASGVVKEYLARVEDFRGRKTV